MRLYELPKSVVAAIKHGLEFRLGGQVLNLGLGDLR